MSKPQDPLMGVKCFSIAGRTAYARQRCLGMTDEERRWRAQYLKDQVLARDEPKYVPAYYTETTNIFRRLYKSPLNALQKMLEPIAGAGGAYVLRQAIGKGLMLIALGYIGTYYFKYGTNDFTRFRTGEFNIYRKIYPDHPDYPNIPPKEPSDYYDLGFYSSVLCQKIEPPEEVVEEVQEEVVKQVIGGVVVECPADVKKDDNQ